MSEFENKIAVEQGSNKNFALVFGAISVVIACWPLFSGGNIRWFFAMLAAFFLFGAFLYPALFTKPNRWWFKFGMLLGAVVAPVVMTITYLAAVVPIGLLMRVLGRDLMNAKLDKEATTYWVERTDAPQPLNRQY